MNSKTGLYKGDREINNLLLIILLLLIFDGSLRKWVFPSLSTPLLLIKDIIVIYTYVIAIYKKKFPGHLLAKFTYVFAFIYLGIAILQIILSDLPYFTVVYGWRNYFFLAPLCFVIEENLKWNDFKRLARIICLISIPSALLVVIQYSSPVDAFINRGVGLEGDENIFVVVEGVVRPYGFFSFTNGQALYSALLLSLCLINFFLPRTERFLNNYMSVIVLLATIINIVTSGSRTNFAQAGLTVAALVFTGLVTFRSKTGFKIVLTSIVGVVLSIILLFTVFSNNMENMQERQALASKVEGSFLGRAIRPYTMVFTGGLPDDIPFLGYGLGIATAANIVQSGLDLDMYYEAEWVRVITETGILFGVFYLALRIFIAFYILNKSLKILNYYKIPIIILLLVSIFRDLIAGQVSFNNTACYFAWFTIGFCFACIKFFDTMKIIEENSLPLTKKIK